MTVKHLIIALLLLLYGNDLKATQALDLPRESTDRYKVLITKMDGNTIKGVVISYTDETITVLPGTKKEMRMGKVFFPETIPYYQIKSIRVIEINLLMLIFFGVLFYFFWKIITGEWDPPKNSDANFNLFIYLSPFGVIASIVGLLRRKKFKINGNKEKYTHFLTRLKKFFPIISDE